MFSKEETSFVTSGVECGVRNDGRSHDCYREISVETGVIPHLYGSSRVSIGKTLVIASVSLKVGEPLHPLPQFGVIDVKVTPRGCIDEFGRRSYDPSKYSMASTLLQMAYSSPNSLKLKDLCIIPGQKCWVINVDVMVVEDDGNVVDAAGLSAFCALHSLKIPRVSVTESEGAEEIEVDEEMEHAAPLDTSSLPLVVTAYVIGDHPMLDASLIEERCAGISVTLGVDRSTSDVVMLQTDGHGSITSRKLTGILELAKQAATALSLELSQVLVSPGHFVTGVHRCF